MTKAKSGDFVVIEYEGRDAVGNVFDSTSGKVSVSLRGKEGPITVVLGSGQILSGLEEVIYTLDEGQSAEVSLSPDKAFGHRSNEFVKTVRESELKSKGISPKTGVRLEAEIGGTRLIGVVKSVNSGRVVIDFNHPLAGKSVIYKVKLVKVLKTDKEKVEAILGDLGKEFKLHESDGGFVAEVKEITDAEKEAVKSIVKSLVGKELTFRG